MICYFSATGNTRWVAQQLAEATGEQLVSITDLRAETAVGLALAEGERLGICFPVHGWRPPTLVRDFARRLAADTRGHYVYALCTAGDTIGETMDILAADLATRGIVLNATFSLPMPNTYVGLPMMDVDAPDLARRKLAAATGRMAAIARAVTAREGSTLPLNVGRWPRINSRLIGSVFVSRLITDRPFRVNTDRCVGCGLCAKVCPVGDIRAEQGHAPEWLHNGACLTCFACYHHCPHHAIAFGRRTRGKGQYFFQKMKT